jgi:hypothetical protein
MKKTFSVLLCSMVLLAGVPPSTFAAAVAKVTGTVAESSGSPVSGATITAKDPNGNVIGTAVSDAQGNSSMSLPVGTSYTLEITPPVMYIQTAAATPPQGTLAAQGTVVNWIVSKNAQALWFVLGAVTFTAGAVGGALGTRKKDIVSPAN